MRTEKKTLLKIGYRRFLLSFVKRVDKEDSLGLCVRDSSQKKWKGSILIAKGLDAEEKANTVIHEVLHAIWYTQGLQYSDATEERVVNALANGLSAFVRDNPRFVLRLLKTIWLGRKTAKP